MRFAHLLALAGFAVAAGWGALEGCASNAPTTSYTPITGIEIPSAEIVAGHGCGAGSPNQVYKYAAVVAFQPPIVGTQDGAAMNVGGDADGAAVDGGGVTTAQLVTSGVFDCFADGVFSNLPQDDAGNSNFVVTIYAYDQCSFPQALACSSNAGTACPAEDPNFVTQSVAAQPSNWTTTCTVTQTPGITVNAYCPRLQPQGAAPPCADAGAE